MAKRKIVGSGKRSNESPKSLSLTAAVSSAIKNLRCRKGATERKIVGFIGYASNMTERQIKRQVKGVLKRGVKYGVLRRYRGQYYLPTGGSVSPTNKNSILRYNELLEQESLQEDDNLKGAGESSVPSKPHTPSKCKVKGKHLTESRDSKKSVDSMDMGSFGRSRRIYK